MRKKVLPGIFVVCVLLLSITLTAGILIAGPSAAGANEVLSKAPQLTDKEGKLNDYFLQDTANWVNDHFFARQSLISAHNGAVHALFGESAAEDVICGGEDWLYYASTLPDYTGTNAMSRAQIQTITRNLLLMQQYCQAQGREFLFVIAPNKNSLYPEHMPDYGVCDPSVNARQLMDELTAQGVAHVDLFRIFSQQEQALYFAHDSHWNSQGAALGADSINAAFGVQSSYFSDAFAESAPHQGDLYEMLYPAWQDKEQDPVYGGELAFTYGSKATKPDSITLLTESQRQGSLLCYRDSFGNLLYPYLADSYGACRFSRSVNYDLTQEGDKVLIQLVERNLSYLYTNLPVMPAPQRELTDLPAAAGTMPVQSKQVKNPEGMYQVTGALPVTPDEASPVYLICNGAAYEAFRLQEKDFGAYLPGEPEAVAFYAAGVLQQYIAQ